MAQDTTLQLRYEVYTTKTLKKPKLVMCALFLTCKVSKGTCRHYNTHITQCSLHSLRDKNNDDDITNQSCYVETWIGVQNYSLHIAFLLVSWEEGCTLKFWMSILKINPRGKTWMSSNYSLIFLESSRNCSRFKMHALSKDKLCAHLQLCCQNKKKLLIQCLKIP